MSNQHTIRRLTLRQLLTHTDKCSRDLYDLIYTTFLSQISDFRDLSRPVRRRSHFPTMVAVQNAMRKLLKSHEEVQSLVQLLEEYLAEVREHAKRELSNRA
jgi:hypothetical protein